VTCYGHENARRTALAKGIAVTPLASGFAATSDPARLQKLCDLVQAGTCFPTARASSNTTPCPSLRKAPEPLAGWSAAVQR
jgi:hypothetical protein